MGSEGSIQSIPRAKIIQSINKLLAMLLAAMESLANETQQEVWSPSTELMQKKTHELHRTPTIHTVKPMQITFYSRTFFLFFLYFPTISLQ